MRVFGSFIYSFRVRKLAIYYCKNLSYKYQVNVKKTCISSIILKMRLHFWNVFISLHQN